MNASELRSLQSNARWFIRMRWVAIIVATVLVVISTSVLHLLPRFLAFPLLVTIATLGIVNLIYFKLSRIQEFAPRLISVQIYVDLVALMIMLHFSGGIENPLAVVGLVHVVIAGIVVSRKQSLVVAGVSSGLFALLSWAEWADLVAHYTFRIFPHDEAMELHAAHSGMYVLTRVLLQLTLLFVFWFFVSSIAQRLREKEDRLRAASRTATSERELLNQSLLTTGSGVRVVGHDLVELWSNENWREYFCCSRIEQQPSELVEVAQGVLDRGKRVISKFDVAPCQHHHSIRFIQITTARLASGGDGKEQIVHLAQDMTKSHELQLQMIRAERLAAVGELSSQIAHEVNNPVGIISAKARLLVSRNNKDMSDHVFQEIQKIIKLADRVAQVARGLLDFGRPSRFPRVASNICRIVNNATDLVAHKAERAKIRLDVELVEDCPNLMVNADQIEQVFVNLLLNAIDASPAGGVVTISGENRTASGSGSPNSFRLVFKDSGCGISDEMAKRIFEPFFSSKPKGEGTGLGLPVCRRIVEDHGGSITVANVGSSGARFVVEIPIVDTEPEGMA